MNGVKLVQDQLKLSVCVITYNQKRYIRDCLQSLIDQETDFDFEIIVGDDCSNDGTREILVEMAMQYAQIRPLFQLANTGGSRNYLEVHNAAIGRYVAHVDGDDLCLPGKLQAQSDVLDLKSEISAVWHLVDYFDDSGQFSSGATADLSMFKNGAVKFSDAIRLGFVGVHSSLMYRRIQRATVPLEQRTLDLYLTWDLLSKGDGFYIDKVLGRYRIASVGSLSASSPVSTKKLAIAHARLFLQKHPERRADFFIWAASHAVLDIKNLKKTALDLILFAFENLSLVSPGVILFNLLNIRKNRVRWCKKSPLSRRWW